jgi:Flp pilus assembly pilin Flp
MLSRLISGFRKEDRAQDLIEYTLLIGFLALGVVGFFAGSGTSVTGIWSSASSTIAVANGSSGPSVSATNPNPGDPDHNHGDEGP